METNVNDILLLAPPLKPPFHEGGGGAPQDSVTVQLPGGQTKEFSGRSAWALKKLHSAGSAGLSTLELPAGIRWSHYVYLLRRDGVGITMKREKHAGDFPGSHGRYRLSAPVSIIAEAHQ
jgi:hypothetical protein